MQTQRGEKGTVFLTQKSFQPVGCSDCVCLYRATDGAHKKYSTHVSAGDSVRFHSALMNLMKTSMGKLKRAEKKKEKRRAKATLSSSSASGTLSK